MGGPSANIGALWLGCIKPDGTAIEIGEISYLGADWFKTTAGIVEVPEDRSLSDEERINVETLPLCLLTKLAGQTTIVSKEPAAHVRADQFVARLNPGDRTTIRFHASRLGRPLPNARLNFFFQVPDDRDAQAHFPVAGLDFPSSVATDASGNAELQLLAHDPGSVRFFSDGSWREHVDGQVYRIVYQLDGIAQPNPSNFLSVLVWNTFVPDEPPTWHGSLRHICAQYGNLYPWMTKAGPRLDMASYDQIAEARENIVTVLSLADTDAHYMPVTRDLSETRRKALLRWLTEVGSDGRPLLGAPPQIVAGAIPPKPPPRAAMQATGGGKTAAGQRVSKVRFKLRSR